MGVQYLKYLGMSINMPSNHSYADLGFVDNLESAVNKHWQRYRSDHNIAGVTSTGCYQTDDESACHTATAMKRYNGMNRLYMDSVSSHEQAHVAHHTGNIKALEEHFGLYLVGKDSEDIANLVMLARLEEKGYNLDKVLYSKENRKGMVVTDSTKSQSPSIQLSYHSRIINDYKRQKKSKKMVRRSRRSKS